MTTNTKSPDYARRLLQEQDALWKNILKVQAPYQWNLRRLKPGRTLEIGCGIGRNQSSLGPGSIGIDHNLLAVQICRQRGFEAYTPNEFINLDMAEEGRFDSLLLSHILEHMNYQDAIQCVAQYMHYLKQTSKIILITPQEMGFRRDASHVEFMPFDKLRLILSTHGFRVTEMYSFPFPRWFGKVFPYNEFVVVGMRS